MEYIVNLMWDKDACVWIATSEDIEGLVLESNSLDALIEKVKYAVPELIALNHSSITNITIHFKSERHEKVALYGGI